MQQHDFHDNVQDGVEDTESNLHIAFKDGNKRRWVRPKRNPEEQLNKYELGFDPRKDWHTYGCEITKEELNFFVDGKKVGKTLKNTHWGKLPLRVIMSLGMRVPFVDFGGNAFTSFDPQGIYPNNDRLQNLAERARKQLGELPESMYVDYVRVWNKKSNNTNGETTFKVFPNPSLNGIFNITLLKLKKPSKLTITDLSGKVLLTKKITKKTTKVKTKLQKGIYVLKIKNGNSTLSKRIIIN